MKILLINGSPRCEKSNSLRLAEAFIEGITQVAPATKTKTIHCNKMHIDSCLGCFACWNKTPGECCIKDDMKKILADMLWADTIVFSFPLYYFSVPGKLKTVLDRQLPLALPFMTERQDGLGSGSHPSRYDFSQKRYVLVSTCGFYSTKGNYTGVTTLFDHICGKENYTAIFCAQGELFSVQALKARTSEYLSHVRQAGSEFAQSNISAATQEKLAELLLPKETFEKLADASWGIEKSSATAAGSAGGSDAATHGVSAIDASLVFTTQMAALYNKKSWDGKDRVLEMRYTDKNMAYQILLKKDGEQVLSENFLKPTTIIETPFTVWQDIAEGKISGQTALMEQKYRVTGDFNLMVRWDDFFGIEGTLSTTAATDSPANTTGAKNKASGRQKKTQMFLFLYPWIVFWAAVPTSSFWGASAALASCALLSVFYLFYQSTIYEAIAAVCVSALSLAALAGVSIQITLSLSYLLFGLIWSSTVFLPIPFTAHYSMNEYGGNKALENPLFVKTNRILTALWGVFYLCCSVWTYIAMGTWYGFFVSIGNSIMPLFLGIFTMWFQKWYPAKVARGKNRA